MRKLQQTKSSLLQLRNYYSVYIYFQVRLVFRRRRKAFYPHLTEKSLRCCAIVWFPDAERLYPRVLLKLGQYLHCGPWCTDRQISVIEIKEMSNRLLHIAYRYHSQNDKETNLSTAHQVPNKSPTQHS